MQSVERITNMAAENIKQLVLRHLKSDDDHQNSVENVSNERIKRTYNYNLTEAEVREGLTKLKNANWRNQK